MFVWLLHICYLSPLVVTLADVGDIQLSPQLLGLVTFGILRGDTWRTAAAS